MIPRIDAPVRRDDKIMLRMETEEAAFCSQTGRRLDLTGFFAIDKHISCYTILPTFNRQDEFLKPARSR
jgi:hypothetical protein